MFYSQVTHWYSGVEFLAAKKTYNWSLRPKPGRLPLTMLKNLICSCVTGQPEVFKITSGRILILTSYVTSLVVMAAYSAFVMSSLAVQHQRLPFRDLQGLLYDGSYRLGVMRSSSYFNMFNVWGIKYLWPSYLLGVGLWCRRRWKGVKTYRINRVLFGNYFKLTEVLSLSKYIKLLGRSWLVV